MENIHFPFNCVLSDFSTVFLIDDLTADIDHLLELAVALFFSSAHDELLMINFL